ncbi:MAG: permease [Proteobacteria bacterium]|nr:permease [Pseudomonadota bacterium]
MECCHHEKKEAPSPHGHCAPGKRKFDYLLWGSLAVIAAGLAAHAAHTGVDSLDRFGMAVAELLKAMWWGIVLGVIAVGLMQKAPREYFTKILGRGDTFGGLLRAAAAGVLLDLCSHGILMVGAKLYERGASLAQVITFLIASPWNSLSLTLILIALIGLKWTLVFIVGSAVIAVATGYLYMILTKRGVLAGNPNKAAGIPDGFDMRVDIKARLKGFRPTPRFFISVLKDGLSEGRMVMRWLFFGTVLAALIRAFVETDTLVQYFGPTALGLLFTLAATTIIEVCSEGSAPIGAELVNRAAAPGNGFAFLMAGVATDYTEILVLRQTAGSWKSALFLPLLTIPQVLLLGWVMNLYG